MSIAFIIVIALAVGLAIALFFQIKNGHRQADEQEKLLADYQHRVNEQQKLLDDYRALEKNLDSVGEGYEQALQAFEKMEQEQKKTQQLNESLEKRCAALQDQCTRMQEHSLKAGEVIDSALAGIREIAKSTADNKLAALVGKISDMDDVDGQKAIARTDNILVVQVADEAIAATGIDKISYLAFEKQVDPVAAATMLSTNLTKAVRALTHILDNALKFTSEGTVTLKVAVDMDKMVAIYTVEDTGAGIEPAEQEHIFEPYVKLNQFFDGLGIGLTVARSIARRLDGDVVLDTAYEGPGARFVLTLPI
jgi:signal transduction histidine kinase